MLHLRGMWQPDFGKFWSLVERMRFCSTLLVFILSGNILLADDQQKIGSAISFAAAPASSTKALGRNWMKSLPETLSLSNLSIPGTHDTCALRNGFSFGFAKCQSWTLEDQLEAGIRFLDIRCRHRLNRFEIYHGVISQEITFMQVLDICEAFLKKNPSECLLMSVKEESSREKVTRGFRETFLDEIDSRKDLWLITEKTPSLKESRGRIVLVDRVGNLGGLRWDEMSRQDAYQATPEEKKIKVGQQFDLAANGDSGQWFLNYSSGTVPTKLITPAGYASILNPFVLDQLRQRKGKHLGVVVMDFPGDSLVERIIQSNHLRHQNPRKERN